MRAIHATHLVVWDVPPAVERGETFCVKVGVKCNDACRPNEWTVEIRDHAGQGRASALVGTEPWAGTAALYFAELALAAPEEEGLYTWRVLAPAAASGDGDEAAEHGEARTTFNVRVVPAAECRMTIVAIDRETRAPIERAKVVIHPYRALTDARGIAQLRVPKGPYRLFVSGREHFPFRSDGVASEDATIHAELETDTGPSDAELWS